VYTFWSSKETFLKYGFGYVLLDGNKIVGHVISASVEDGEAEIDIQTDLNYRGKGLASLLVSRFIDECHVRSTTPKWDCAHDNVASNKLAISHGFVRVKKYPFCIIKKSRCT
jgi:RimJ/RimL family protein N-acetyltransferase